MIHAPEEGAPNKGTDDTKRPKKAIRLATRIELPDSRCKTEVKLLTTLRTDCSDIKIPDEKVHPTLETVPKSRYSARWECCLLTAPRGSHRRPGDPGPVATLDLPR